MQPAVIAIDQGTTSSRALIFDERLERIASAQLEFPQIYPGDGWVEHDPEAIWDTTLAVTRDAISEATARGFTPCALGITNQRETTVVWDRESGAPLHNAIVWQDRRTAETCRHLADTPANVATVSDRTGLLLDPYFSAGKIAWILDHVDGARRLAARQRLAFGTIDSFLIWRLTGGEVHATDVTNASRTSLFDIDRLRWDDDLLALFDVPADVLPQVRDCNADFGMTASGLLPERLPILGVAGDQQAAAIGQCCFEAGAIKSTYGTGCFVIMNTGESRLRSDSRLLSTIAYAIDGRVSYALEGSIFVAGAAVQWLRDELGIIADARETESIAAGLPDNGGVYLVPAFAGLGAPHWDPAARGAILGLSRGTGAAHIVRAALESVAYQTADLFAAMARDGVAPESLRVDGGMVANDWMLQFLADILDLDVERPTILETTALGAAYLAGRTAGVYGDFESFAGVRQVARRFSPGMAAEARTQLLDGWRRAVTRVTTSAF